MLFNANSFALNKFVCMKFRNLNFVLKNDFLNVNILYAHWTHRS